MSERECVRVRERGRESERVRERVRERGRESERKIEKAKELIYGQRARDREGV